VRAVGLRTYIWNNAWKAALLLAGFPVLLLLICFALALLAIEDSADSFLSGLRQAAALMPALVPAVLAVTAAWFGIAVLANQKILDLLSGAHPVTRKQEPRLWNLLENLCISRGMAMPRLAVIESPARNAFASGLSRKTGAVTVTRGLMEALTDRELAAVLAHELTHIRNGDARLGVIAAVFAGIISLIAELIFRGMRYSGGRSSSSSKREGRGGGGAGALVLVALALAAASYLLAIALRFALSRNREFVADAGSVELTQDPDAMILALRKVAGHSELPRLPSQLQALLLDSPPETVGNAWLATHPSLEERIAALVRYAGGRDPGPLAVSPSPAAPGALPANPWLASEQAAAPAELPWWRRR